MKNVIIAGCLSFFSIVAAAQQGNRVRSGNNLRWAMNGSVEIMEGDLAQQYGTSDSASFKRFNTANNTATTNNPRLTRFSTVQGQCDNNSLVLNWSAVQQPGTDRYEIEQSTDGVSNWKNVGTVLANQTQVGTSVYSFNYYKNASDLFFRIVAVSANAERLYISIFKSPCSVNSFLSIVPNPVYSSAVLRIGAQATEKIRILLVDTRGNIVQRKDLTLSQGANSHTLDMSGLTPGYYSVAIQRGNGKQDILNVVKQ